MTCCQWPHAVPTPFPPPAPSPQLRILQQRLAEFREQTEGREVVPPLDRAYYESTPVADAMDKGTVPIRLTLNCFIDAEVSGCAGRLVLVLQRVCPSPSLPTRVHS